MRRSNRLVIFILVAALIGSAIGSGCEKDSDKNGLRPAAKKQVEKAAAEPDRKPELLPTPADELRRYGPSKPGMKWKFRVTVTTEGIEVPLTATAENLAPARINGVTVDQAKLTVDGMPELNQTHYSVVDDSAVLTVAGKRHGKLTTYKKNQKHMILKYPLEVGSMWETTGRGPKGEPVPSTVEILATDEVMTVVGGTYSGCVKVKQTDIIKIRGKSAISEGYAWYAPDIGPIKTEVSIRVDGKEIVFTSMELEKFLP